jgi:three-Cys-motif partner protein
MYLEAWLAIFFNQKVKGLEIYDFFAGSGYDIKGESGSPILILENIRNYCNKILEFNSSIRIIFNENKPSKSKELKIQKEQFISSCKSLFCSTNTKECPFHIDIYEKDFLYLFNEFYPTFKNTIIPRFMFINQYGIKNVPPEIFKQLTSIEKTDFIFFISSSYVKRFAQQQEFKKYLETQDIHFDDSKFSDSHRKIFEYYKTLLPYDKEYYLGQFTLSKNSNYYGLIFGSNHPLGLEKFLNSAWKINNLSGDANCNLDKDSIGTGQLSWIEDDNKSKKLFHFECNLLNWLGKNGKNNNEVYKFSLENGIAIFKTNKILKDLENKNKILISNLTSEKRRKGAYYLGYKQNCRILIMSNHEN